jgi:hypothetical protein
MDAFPFLFSQHQLISRATEPKILNEMRYFHEMGLDTCCLSMTVLAMYKFHFH